MFLRLSRLLPSYSRLTVVSDGTSARIPRLAPEDVTALEVQLLSPGGEIGAKGRVDIGRNSSDFVPPVPKE